MLQSWLTTHSNPGELLEELRSPETVFHDHASFDLARGIRDRHSLADKHAPAGLMGAHVHNKGEVMIEYKYMNMYMEDNRLGETTVTDQDSFALGQALGTNNGATPTQMTMEMHMMHIMYGVTDDVTVYLMPMLLSNTMDHLRNNPFPNPAVAGQPFTTHISGFGDMQLGALWRVWEDECRHEEIVLNLGASVPTGQVDRKTTVPSGGVAVGEFPYPMRLGRGTFNFRPGATYRRFLEDGSFGLQFQADLPVDENWDEYSVGEDYRVNAWYAHLLTEDLAISYRVEGQFVDNYDGADPDVNGAVISTLRPDMRGGDFLNFGYGVMYLAPGGNLINFEVVHPVHQDVDGIQLERDWWFAISWSKTL
ncbi:MAG: hypothetical protein CMJ78_25590 [Planctomycetaceae bacterium]|nr:hypothetical protein [Planctomycetaceae bacterium]